MKKSQIALFILITVLALNFTSCEVYAPVSDDALLHTDNHRSMLEHYNAIIQEATETIRLDPNDAANFLIRGYAYFYIGDIDRAFADLNTSIQLQPDNVYYFYYWRSYFYNHIGEYDLSIADISEAIRIGPEYHLWPMYIWRIKIYMMMGEYNLADADFYEIIRLFPGIGRSSYLNLGGLYFHRGEYDRAIAVYSEAIQLGLAHSTFYYERAWVYYYKGDYDLVLADINELIRLQSNNEWLYFYRSELYRHKGDLAKAEADLARAKELGYVP